MGNNKKKKRVFFNEEEIKIEKENKEEIKIEKEEQPKKQNKIKRVYEDSIKVM